LLEQKAAQGRIAVYGAATWNGFRADPHDRGYLSLDDLVGLMPFSRAIGVTLERAGPTEVVGTMAWAARRPGCCTAGPSWPWPTAWAACVPT